jgi:transmembrane sensor
MRKARLKGLLHQYFDNTINNADCIELLDYINSADSSELNELIDGELSLLDEGPAFNGQQSRDVLNRIKSDIRFSIKTVKKDNTQPEIVKLYQIRWLQIAAAVLLFCTAGLFMFNGRNSKSSYNIVKSSKPAIILPGRNKAILIMAGGRTIILDSAANGLIAQTNAGKVFKTHSGQIIYKDASSTTNAEIGYNTLSTPKGGEYQVVLPDGTKVWLDAASSITYPIAFTSNERKVKLIGQAYFEVAKNKEKPFYVNINNNAQVRVLGTHFNISAYPDDDDITTTLLEGSVQVSKNSSISMLKPGQQAIITGKSNNIVVSNANIDYALAWKNGYFIFNDDNISGIMRKISRWYDVDVEYSGNYNDQQFGGTFFRSKSITELLDHLQKIGRIHFIISGRRIIVMN